MTKKWRPAFFEQNEDTFKIFIFFRLSFEILFLSVQLKEWSFNKGTFNLLIKHVIQILKIDPACILDYVDEADDLVWWEWLTDKRCWALFTAGTIAGSSYHLQPPTRDLLNLKLHRTWDWTLFNGAAWSTHYTSLRILTWKTHPQIKLRSLRKVGIWTFGQLVH